MSNVNLKPGGLLVEKAVSERRKAFATAHRIDEDRQAYISTSRHALLSLLNLCILSFVLSLALLRHLPPLTSPTVLLPGSRLEIPLFCLQPKVLRSRAGGSLSELCRAMCSKESHSVPSSPPLNFLWLPQTSPRPLPLAHTKLPIPC